MLKRLPTDDAVVLYVDFARLRSGGILQLLDGSKVGEDPEYRSFVRQDRIRLQAGPGRRDGGLRARSGKYMLLKGRFDWKSLKSYVRPATGSCNNSFCKMAGSTPEKRISFFPMQSNLMAMAVSDDDVAALRMNQVDDRPDAEIPNAPIWLSIPPSVVKSGQSLPAGTQMFARSLERAQAVTLAVVPEGDRLRRQTECPVRQRRPTRARWPAELNKTTGLLREMIEREHQTPNPADLSGFLTSGHLHEPGPEGPRLLAHHQSPDRQPVGTVG